MLNYLELENFPSLELVCITAPIGATFLRQRSAQRKNVEPSISTLKRLRVEASTAAPTIGDLPTAVDPTIKEIHVDPTTNTDIADPTLTPPLLLRAMIKCI